MSRLPATQDKSSPNDPRHWLAVALATAKRPNRAVLVAQRIENQWARASALTHVSVALAQAGLYDDAEGVAGEVDSLQAFGSLAEIMAKRDVDRANGLIDKAQRILSSTLAELPQETSNGVQYFIDCEPLILALVTVGRSDEAMELLRTPTDEAAFLKALASLGHYETARLKVAEIRDPRARVQALLLIAAELFRQELFPETAAVAVQAENVARTAGDNQGLANALAWRAGTSAALGDSDACEALVAEATAQADQAGDPSPVAWAMREVAETLCSVGLHREAEVVASGIYYVDIRESVFGTVVQAKARARLYDEAEKLALGIPDPNARGRALVGLAKIIAESGSKEDAIRVVVASLACGQWSDIVSVVLQLDSSIVDDLDDSIHVA